MGTCRLYIIKFIITFILIFNFKAYGHTSQDDSYYYTIDLNRAAEDQLLVELVPPKQTEDIVIFRLPAVIPGSYTIHNFGRYVSKAWAYDNQGNILSMQKVDGTSWMIMGATGLAKIEYKIDDTFDDGSVIDKVFEPTGTSFEQGSVFLINTHCIFGYIEGETNRTFNLSVIKPSNFYGSTCLNAWSREAEKDVFVAADFKDLMDNPILYCEPDTTTIQYDDASVFISVYSKTKNAGSVIISNYIKDVISSHRKIAGGKLQVDKYAFIFYLFDPKSSISAYGAHEHLRSSVYFMPDSKSKESKDMNEFSKNVREIAAHEFYHLVTPLTLRSEELTEFNINKRAEMSRHLWLYEGITEYMAHYSLLVNGFITQDDFRKSFQRKMNNSEFYNKSISFTDMSLNVHDKYKKEFTNVYQKGAVIGLCLDLLIRKETAGQTGLPDVILQLIQKYGKERPFKDEELFGEIEALTTPGVGDFLRRYISGTETLPYKDLLPLAGFKYSKIDYNRVSFGNSEISINLLNYHPYFVTVDQNHPFCRNLGLVPEDEIVGINGKYFLFVDYSEVFGSPEDKVKNGDDIEFIIRRRNSNGLFFYTQLEGKIAGTLKTTKHKLAVNDKMSDNELKIYNTWLGK
jgi:predicted metalloprotease with PDZ domain